MSIASISLVPKVVVQELESLNGVQIPGLANSAFLGTDAQGNIVDVSGGNQNYNGKCANDTIISGQIQSGGDYINDFVDNSLISVDYNSRVCHVWLNITGKMELAGFPPSVASLTPDTTQSGCVVIAPNNTQGSEQPPFPNTDIQEGYFQGSYVDTSATTNNSPLTFYWNLNQATNLINIYIYNSTTPVANANDDIQIFGYFAYLF